MPNTKNLVRTIHNKSRAVSNIVKGAVVTTSFGRNACLWLNKNKSPLFASVEIETTSICNRKCAYCPNSVEKRPSGYMTEEIFYKIIDELAEINYSGRVSTHLYGEPLVDKRIVKFIGYARKKLPDAFIKFFTNGDLLTDKLLNDLNTAGVDVFRVSQHDEQSSEKLLDMLENFTAKAGKNKIEYMKYFGNDENLMNRGGLVEVAHDVKMKFCNYVSGVTVDFEGNMLLCCQDFLADNKMGNLKNEGLLDVWNKPAYKAMRDRIECGIWPTKLCRVCNGVETKGSNGSDGSVD